jgi:hypothetical protein
MKHTNSMCQLIVVSYHNMGCICYLAGSTSPKRSRRDGKPETERVPGNTDLDVGDRTDRDQKHRHRLQDALPLEATSAPDSKPENGVVSKESEKKPNEHREGPKHSSNTSEVPRSRSFFQVLIIIL